jgi:hypothetical protein
VALARTIRPFEFQGIEKSCSGGGGGEMVRGLPEIEHVE